MKRLHTAILLAWAVGGGIVAVGAITPPQLRYVVIISRHGVRSPTWNSERLNQYATQPWPEWGVPPGNLTPHGRALMRLIGAYYREWLSSERLLSERGCGDAGRIYIHADTDQRTLETGRALAETLLPGCPVAVHSEPEGSRDQLFDPISAGIAKPNWEVAAKAVQERLGDARHFLDLHRAAFETLQLVLAGRGEPNQLIEPPAEIRVSTTGKSVEVNQQLTIASTLSEDLLLEYTNGMQGEDLGWGRLDADTLFRVLELHAAYADLTRRTPYLARARGSNLQDHVLRSMEQAASGNVVPGALGSPGTAVLIISGHDTNLSNLSGMLGLSWQLPGYQPDDTPPGGALIFSLWQQPGTTRYFVRTQYLAQTLQQMRNATPLTMAAPPAKQDVAVAGCESESESIGCSWETFAKSLQKAIDNRFVSTQTVKVKNDPGQRPGKAAGHFQATPPQIWKCLPRKIIGTD